MIASFEIPITFHLSTEQEQEARAAINMYHLGDTECNYLDPETMQYLPRYPEKETEDFKSANSNVSRTFTAYITVGLGPNGCLFLI